jgi:hypothetical protein
MKRMIAVGLWILLAASRAFGYEHKLQFTPYIPYNFVVPNSLVVIGEQFTMDANGQINGVTGLIHFVTGPNGCRYNCPRTSHDWTGTWDLDGNLLSVVQVAWAPQQPIGIGSSTTPLAETNNEAIYAQSVLPNGNTISTGQDTLFRYGYVDTVQSHLTWTNCGGYSVSCTNPPEYTPGHFVIPRTPPFVFSVSLTSDGDLPLNITSTVIQVTVSGSYTNGTGTAAYVAQPGDCLAAPVTPGTTCSITVSFDPSTIISTASPYGYAYNNFFLSLASDAGNTPDWSVSFTITGFPTPDE